MMRTDASRALSVLFEAIPVATENIETALAEHKISNEEIANAYETCAMLFESDPFNNRLALYFPFELLPLEHAESSRELKEAQVRFGDAYKTAWESLLVEHDLREDFAAGDIIESEHRRESLPRVVKAAHLIPMLMKRGVVSFEEVLSFLENTADTVLKQSVADGLAVANDTGQLTEEQRDCLSRSTSRFAQNVGSLLRDGTRDTSKEVHSQEPHALLEEAAGIWKNEEESLDNTSPMTKSRKKWLLDQKIEHITEAYGNGLRPLINTGTLTPDILRDLAVGGDAILSSLIVIHAVRSAIESLAREDTGTARNSVTQYIPLFELFRAENNTRIQEEVARTFYHLHSLGMLTDQELVSHEFTLPLLDASASRIMHSMQKETSVFMDAAKRIETHPELSKLLYPIIVLLGSRTKGYASGEADLDTAVFVRPDVPEEKRALLQSLTDEILGNAGSEKAMEFWLKEVDGSLAIQDFENPDPQRGDSTLVHPLLGIWCGDKATITELYREMMPQYVYSRDKKILGEEARAVWLKGMEHDLLQYRLLHKGYDRFCAPQGGIRSPHSDVIDSASPFYDSGYRRLATKLYIDKVFLPQLSKNSGNKK